MLPGLPDYAELHCRSNFSFLTGASHPEELVRRAHSRGYAALAITDECSVAGAVRAHAEAKQHGLHLIVGAEMRLSATGAPGAPSRPSELPGGAGARLVLLAQSRRGYGNLVQWITLARRRAAKGSYLACDTDLEGRVPHAPMLAGLPGCFALLVPQPGQRFRSLYAQATWLKTWFGTDRCAIAVERLLRADESRLQKLVQRVAALSGLELSAAGDVLMHSRRRRPLLDVLAATRLRQPVKAAGDALAPNAECFLRSRLRLATLYPPAWMAAAVRIAASCSFSLDELRYEYPQEIVPEGHTPESWLRSLTEQGALRRFPAGVPALARANIEHELALIRQLGFEPYFLTVADIVHWARDEAGILCQGRGSAANSTVCYCLGITEVDPQRASLLFERFISGERNEPPDIDVDFEHQRREEVIQYIYRKYGRHRAALTAVVISYRPRSAMRDVGRALGIDLGVVTAVAKDQHWFDGRQIAPDRLRDNGIDPDSVLARRWVALTMELIGFPRHLSQHPGGFLIARDDIARLVPVENTAMADRTVVQWDKDDLDALGLIKVDILALGMLSAIRRALDLLTIKLRREALCRPSGAAPEALAAPTPGDRSQLMKRAAGGEALRMQDIPAEDPAVYTMLSRADSLGVFQVESRAQMSMLPRLQPRCYYDLVIEVAIVRPGPIQGGMVHPYLRRRNGEEPDDIPHPELIPALGRTRGVPIFQEQVMQIAMIAAEFTGGEADQLRRAMAAWKRKGGLGPFHHRLVERMVERGYAREFAERIFKQIEGFGEYGFPESHAASFALLVYVSAWLKNHHPDAFLAALLNSQPMGFYAPAQLVRDAREHGVEVRPVDVLASEWDTVLEGAPRQEGGRHGAGDGPAGLCAVRLGFSRLTGFREADALRIVATRAERPFNGVEDLARRAALDEHALRLLAQGDALGALLDGAAGGHRHQAAWAVRGIDTRATPLLQSTRTHEDAAELAAPALAEDVVADYHATGLSLKAHPLALLRPQLDAFRVLPAAVLRHGRHGQLARASGLVTHRQRPETAKGVIFVTLEDDTGAVNVIVWPKVAEAQRQALLGARLLTVYGIWQCEGEVRHLIAQRLVDHTDLLSGLVVRSRDFH